MFPERAKLKTQTVKVIRNVHIFVRSVADSKIVLPGKSNSQLMEAATSVTESTIIGNSKIADLDSYQTQTTGKRARRKMNSIMETILSGNYYSKHCTTSTTVEHHLL